MFHDGDTTADHCLAHDDAPSESGDEPPSSRSAPTGLPDAARGPGPVEVHVDPGLRRPTEEHVLARELAERLQRVIAVLDVPVVRLAVRLVGDAAMTTLHRRHCGLDRTTDVLCFCTSAPSEPVDADIACCLDEAGRQARRRGHPTADEVLLYAVHGLLHCLGHDDHDPEAYAVMHAEEDRLLAAIGVGARFATTDRPDQEGKSSSAASAESPGAVS